jgi:hypothetical protein
MYEDVSAVTKVRFSLKSACMCLLFTKSGMEDKSCTLLFHLTERRLKRTLRSTLIPSSTSPVTPSRLGRLMCFRCLFRAPRLGELMGGRIMKMTKTLQKVRPSYGSYIDELHRIPRCYGTRHLGSRPAQVTVSQCYNEQSIGCSASRASSCLLPPPSWLGYNWTFLQTSLKGVACFYCLCGILMRQNRNT